MVRETTGKCTETLKRPLSTCLMSHVQATGRCLWACGCRGRATVTTRPTALATASERNEQEAAAQHNRARDRRQPPPLMVTHTKDLLLLG